MERTSPTAALADAMARRGLSQRAAEQLLGVSSGYICNVLRGRKRPSLNVAARIERELGVPAREWAVSS